MSDDDKTIVAKLTSLLNSAIRRMQDVQANWEHGNLAATVQQLEPDRFVRELAMLQLGEINCNIRQGKLEIYHCPGIPYTPYEEAFIRSGQELDIVNDGEIEIDSCHSAISESCDGGEYVLGWIWVSNNNAKLRQVYRFRCHYSDTDDTAFGVTDYTIKAFSVEDAIAEAESRYSLPEYERQGFKRHVVDITLSPHVYDIDIVEINYDDDETQTARDYRRVSAENINEAVELLQDLYDPRSWTFLHESLTYVANLKCVSTGCGVSWTVPTTGKLNRAHACPACGIPNIATSFGRPDKKDA